MSREGTPVARGGLLAHDFHVPRPSELESISKLALNAPSPASSAMPLKAASSAP